MKRTWKQFEGSVKYSSPNAVFSYNSLYKRYLAGQQLYKGNAGILATVNLGTEAAPNNVTVWRYLVEVNEPGSQSKLGYWQVSYADVFQAFVHLRGQLPKYACTCPDHTLRLQPAPLNNSNSRKFPEQWSGLLRDCKHIWATRFLNDEIKLIDPLPNDVPLPPDELLKPKSTVPGMPRPDTIATPNKVAGITNPASINNKPIFLR